MAFSDIHLIILLSYAVLFFGLHNKDYTISTLGGMLVCLLGMYISLNGLDTLNNFLTDSLAIICIGVGAFAFLGATIQNINNIGMYSDQ